MLVLQDIELIGDTLVTTGERYNEVHTEGGLLDPTLSGEFKHYQKVLFASKAVVERGIKVGDTVLINYENYGTPIQKRSNSVQKDMEENYYQQMVYRIPILEIDRKECMYLTSRDIKCIIKKFEDTIDVSTGITKVEKRPRRTNLLLN